MKSSSTLTRCLVLGATAIFWGSASAQEAGARRQEIVKKYDKDQDGRLSPEEWQALRNDVRDGKLEVPPQVRERILRPRGARPGGARRAPRGVTVERDVEYGRAGDRPLTLDVVLPEKKSDEPLPAIAFIHGGGWRGGNKSGGVGRVAPLVASGNSVGFSVGYRLTGEAIWPAQIHDCKAAIRWIRANARKYHVDPDRIGVWGSSAGGHLVSMLGTSGDVEKLEGGNGSPDQSSCVVDFCGPSDFTAAKKMEGGREPSAVTLLLGGPPQEKRDVAREASPVTYVSKDDPPFLIVHGTGDGTVPLQQAEILYEALTKAGCKPVFIKIDGGGHGIGGAAVQERVNAFLEKHLRGQDVEIKSETIPAERPPRPKPKR